MHLFTPHAGIIRNATEYLTPLIHGDKLLEYKPDELEFRAWVDARKMKREVMPYLQKLGFRGHFWHGVTKIVIPHMDFVLKCPIHGDFVEFVMAEWREYDSHAEKDREFFAETAMIRAESGILVQEYCEPDKAAYEQVVDQIMEVSDALGLHDIHHNNVGFRQNGEWRIIDAQSEHDIDKLRNYEYGPGKKRRDMIPGRVYGGVSRSVKVFC
jgi:hypothetical protein